ncbi:hypothetical protein Tco_1293684 [Tanacetum coccineum]
MDNSKHGHIPMQERLDLNKTQGASTPKEVKLSERNLMLRLWFSIVMPNTKDMFLVYGGNPKLNFELIAIANPVETGNFILEDGKVLTLSRKSSPSRNCIYQGQPCGALDWCCEGLVCDGFFKGTCNSCVAKNQACSTSVPSPETGVRGSAPGSRVQGAAAPGRVQGAAPLAGYFFMTTGLKINLHKNEIMGIGIRSEEVEYAASVLGCSMFSPHFVHLGVKVDGAMTRINSWDEVISKVSSRLFKWKTKDVCALQRLIFILNGRNKEFRPLSILKNALMNEEASHNVGLASCFSEIAKLLSISIADGRHCVGMKLKVSIETMDFEHFKRIVPPGLLMTLKRKKLNEDDGDSNNSNLKENVDESASFGRFKKSVAPNEMALKHRYRRLYALESSKQINVAEQMSHTSLVFSYRRVPKGGVEEEHQCLLQSRIDCILLPQMLDRWVWSLKASGEFSVKSVRYLIDDLLLPKEDFPTRWVNVIPIKINVFAWRVRSDKLPKVESLRGVDLSSILCRCNISVESSAHLFVFLGFSVKK